MEKKDEIATIKGVLNVKKVAFRAQKSGFLSEVFVINGGEFVFKFPRNSAASYANEYRALGEFARHDFGVQTQRIYRLDPNGAFLALRGIVGVPLCDLKTHRTAGADEGEIGAKLGHFIRALHATTPSGFPTFGVEREIETIRERYDHIKGFLQTKLTGAECEFLKHFVCEFAPARYRALNEKLVFSHGDLNSGNILLCPNGELGIIDCAECGYFDESIDLANLGYDREGVVTAMLDAYGADDNLRQKVEIRRALKPIRTLKWYLERGDKGRINAEIKTIRKIIRRYAPR